ncbi:MAG: class I SAM-dependent methyltransferase [Clostridiales bacterium]|nr:class I SAM-dependent methyltransferase [Clostridiales bacterium]
MNNEQKFSGKANYYDNARPAYAESLLNTLYSDYGFARQSKIADIGSGTGIFTEQLLKRGCTVYGVEPNADMREACEKRLKGYSNFISVNGDAANTKLLDSSVNIVTAAQALHWFPLEEFRQECRRILKPNGLVVIVYNQRCNDIINERIDAVIARTCDLNSASTGPAFIELKRKKINDLFQGKYTEIRKSNSIPMDLNKFLSYWLSRSYAPKSDDDSYEQFIKVMTAMFKEYAPNGIITIEQESVAYIGYVV